MNNSDRANSAVQDKLDTKPRPTLATVSRRTPPARGAVRGKLPESQLPQLCTLIEESPDGQDWVSEIKLDGYRFLASVDNGAVRLLTRGGHDWADRLPAVRAAVASLETHSAMLDGELVALRPDGVSSFSSLQAALKAGSDHSLVFYAFDLLHLDGWDIRSSTLLDRKRLLARLIRPGGMIRYSDHHQGQGQEMLRGARRLKLEGIVCKRADAPYSAGRNGSWLKVKCLGREEFIVLGWTKPGGSRVGIGALQLGYRDPRGLLHYAGAVGTGFSDHELTRLRNLVQSTASVEPVGLLMSGDPIDPTTVWVRPDLVAEVKYTGWAGSGRLRHAVYLGLREDKSPAEVVRDVANPDAERVSYQSKRQALTAATHKIWHGAAPPRRATALIKSLPVRR